MTDLALAAAEIRRAGASELVEVATLLEAAELPVEGVEACLRAGLVWVAEADGRVMGSAALEIHGEDGLIRSVAVDPGMQGRGTGRALVQRALGGAADAGVRRVYLLTTSASAWFAGLGFEEVQRNEVPAGIAGSAEFSALCPSTATVMARDVDIAPAYSGCCGAGVVDLRNMTVAAVGTASEEDVKQAVQLRYGAAARAAESGRASCCGEGSCGPDPITSGLYTDDQTGALPTEAVLASLGCGNPTALARLEPGQTVLDLGSGGGIDVLLSARRVGPEGRVYGLDLTDEMLELARANQARAGITNAEFLKGDMEAIPLPDASVDVIISNCVINLTADKSKVLREAFRVLRPGGRLAISDIVARGDIPAGVRQSMELWVGCIAGALAEDEYVDLLRETGFIDVDLEPTRVYRSADASQFLEDAGVPVPPDIADHDGAFFSAFVRAVRPGVSERPAEA
ncbi:MAG TPA: arsenic resistance N-acetyltransferase ArsN2 [Longimicrobiales bacterium]|nr:arsenic resistance N-acetyltransferase ArsN2 [Longimicrobiales bacterium]